MYSQFSFQNSLRQTLDDSDRLEGGAADLFESAFHDGSARRLWRRPAKTSLHLADALRGFTVTNRYALGVHSIALANIVGSVEKPGDFDQRFRPLKPHSEARWVRVATAMIRGETIPPVELIQVGSAYYVQDGHHRISVAKALGYAYIDAIVTVWKVMPA
jgi:hypothetical protein